jgi:acetolactate synthase-1/3 small subunit
MLTFLRIREYSTFRPSFVYELSELRDFRQCQDLWESDPCVSLPPRIPCVSLCSAGRNRLTSPSVVDPRRGAWSVDPSGLLLASAGTSVTHCPVSLNNAFSLESFRSMKHVLSAMVMNQPGVLAHISGMLASRAYNIESLAVGETEDPAFSRITFVVTGDDKVLDQVRKQLEKIITVVKVVDYQNQDIVERDLMLIKVTASSSTRSEIREMVEIFRGKVVDIGEGHVIIEISGSESKLSAFINLMGPFGIIEMVRTGRVALSRTTALSIESALQPPPVYEEAVANG